MISLDAVVALVINFKNTDRALQEFELLMYEAACNLLAKEFKGEELEDYS